MLTTALLLFGICASAVASHPIESTELVDRLNAGQAPVILDVRTAQEYAQGHIPGAINIPVNDLVSRGAELKPFRDQEIVVYCQTGPRAAYAGHVLKKNGFAEVRDLQGHIHQWLANGYLLDLQISN